jgi:hypothetical protein
VAIRDLAGTGALQESLATTNAHLAEVLHELRTLNDARLEAVVGELHSLNAKVDRLLDHAERQGG